MLTFALSYFYTDSCSPEVSPVTDPSLYCSLPTDLCYTADDVTHYANDVTHSRAGDDVTHCYSSDDVTPCFSQHDLDDDGTGTTSRLSPTRNDVLDVDDVTDNDVMPRNVGPQLLCPQHTRVSYMCIYSS